MLSRSILGFGLPSSANGNCEWPLPVHWNCLFASNQGAFNVSCVSGRSALICGSNWICRNMQCTLSLYCFSAVIILYSLREWWVSDIWFHLISVCCNLKSISHASCIRTDLNDERTKCESLMSVRWSLCDAWFCLMPDVPVGRLFGNFLPFCRCSWSRWSWSGVLETSGKQRNYSTSPSNIIPALQRSLSCTFSMRRYFVWNKASWWSLFLLADTVCQFCFKTVDYIVDRKSIWPV